MRVLSLRTRSQNKFSTAALRAFRIFFPAIFTVLFSLLPCCVHLSLRTGPRISTLCSARAFRARYQFGRSGKHDVGHAGGDAIDAGAIGDWGQYVNHRVRNLASMVRVSHQPPKVGQLRVFLVLSLFPRFGVDLRGMRTFAYTRL